MLTDPQWLRTGRLTAQEEFAYLWVLKQFATLARNCDFSRHHDIANIGKLETLFCILLNHDDGLALVMLEIIENLEDHIDKFGLQPNRGFINQQNIWVHNQSAGNLEKATLASGKHFCLMATAADISRILSLPPLWPQTADS